MTLRLDRRQLLNAMGLGAGTLFLPSLMSDRQAHAAGAAKRLLIYYTSHGPPYWDWSMRPAGSGDDMTQDWEFSLDTLPQSAWSKILAPLYPLRKKVLVLDGLANTAAFASTPTNNHNAGRSTIWTGAEVSMDGNEAGGTGGGISVDQVIAEQVAIAGRKKTLYCNVRANSPLFQGKNQTIGGLSDGARLFDSISGFVGTTAAPSGPTNLDKIRKARASLPDLVRPEYDALIKRVGSEDKRKLQGHVDLMNSLQKELQAQAAPIGAVSGPNGGACTLGSKPPGATSILNTVDGQLKLLVAALSCDITRVAVQAVGQLSGSEFGAVSGADVHQDIAHQASAPGSNASTMMAAYYTKHTEQFARLLSMMDAIPEGSGTMLDNTIVAWGTELANGPHDMYRIPFIIGGSGGGYFRTGRYLKYAETGPTPWRANYGPQTRRLGPAHNKLLVSMMQAMGLPNNSIGISAATANSKTGGGPVDMVGPLPRLR